MVAPVTLGNFLSHHDFNLGRSFSLSCKSEGVGGRNLKFILVLSSLQWRTVLAQRGLRLFVIFTTFFEFELPHIYFQFPQTIA